MTIVPKRLGVKFGLKQEPRIQPKDIVPIFQRWIQDHTVDGMLIDVIDYKHVPEGPGVILIADEGDYAYDLGDGQFGLHYIRKRNLPDDLSNALRLAFRHALQAAVALEQEVPGDIEFDFSSAKISFLDRRHYHNDESRFIDARQDIASSLSQIYGEDVEVERLYDDPRRVFAVRCKVGHADFDMQELQKRLQDSRTTV